MKLMFFRADWCGPCRQMEPVMQTIMDGDGFRDHYSMQRVDVDTEPEIAAKWGIRGIPTFVIADDQGKEVARRVGATSRFKMQEWMSDAYYGRPMSMSHPVLDCMMSQLPPQPGPPSAFWLTIRSWIQRIKAVIGLDSSGVNNK